MFEEILEFLHLREHQALEEEQVRRAVTVALLDLAFIDNSFDNKEYGFLHERLQGLLSLKEVEVEELIEHCRNLRVKDGVDPERIMRRVRSRLSKQDRTKILKAMEGLISADGMKGSFEIDLIGRYRRMLLEGEEE